MEVMPVKMQEAHRILNRFNQFKKFLPSHSNRNTKCKEQWNNIKSCKGKSPSNIKSDLSELHLTLTKTQKAKRTWVDILQSAISDHKCQSRLPHQKKAFKLHRENKIFLDKIKISIHKSITSGNTRRKTLIQEV